MQSARETVGAGRNSSTAVTRHQNYKHVLPLIYSISSIRLNYSWNYEQIDETMLLRLQKPEPPPPHALSVDRAQSPTLRSEIVFGFLVNGHDVGLRQSQFISLRCLKNWLLLHWRGVLVQFLFFFSFYFSGSRSSCVCHSVCGDWRDGEARWLPPIIWYCRLHMQNQPTLHEYYEGEDIEKKKTDC